VQAIVIQTFIAAPPATVWAALLARADLLFDGLPPDGWPAEREAQEPVHLRCGWRWTPAPTAVTLTLRDLGDATRLEVRHEGWPDDDPAWEPMLHGHFTGWLHGLALLGLHVETGCDGRAADAAQRGQGRYLLSGEIAAAVAPVFRALTDLAVLERWSDEVLEGAVTVESVEHKLLRWRLPSGTELVAVFRPTPRGTHVALAEYGVADQAASVRWPPLYEKLTRFLL
jgi:uncharacterized protein YndB with AHSA1/START domain